MRDAECAERVQEIRIKLEEVGNPDGQSDNQKDMSQRSSPTR